MKDGFWIIQHKTAITVEVTLTKEELQSVSLGAYIEFTSQSRTQGAIAGVIYSASTRKKNGEYVTRIKIKPGLRELP